MPETTWSAEWPTEPGIYWFHGYRFNSRERPPEMYLVRVTRGRDCLVCVSEGSFIFKREAEGVWTSAIVPDPPS
jgi:hypothetical protein